MLSHCSQWFVKTFILCTEYYICKLRLLCLKYFILRFANEIYLVIILHYSKYCKNPNKLIAYQTTCKIITEFQCELNFFQENSAKNSEFNFTHSFIDKNAQMQNYLKNGNTCMINIWIIPDINMPKHRSSRLEVFRRKDVFRNFSKFTGKHLCQSLFFNKVAGRRPPVSPSENIKISNTIAKASPYNLISLPSFHQ